MDIVFLSHPDFLNIRSITNFTKMLSKGMKERGHHVQIWVPEPKAVNFMAPRLFKKWLGYIDLYVIFPESIKKRLKGIGPKTLFVFTDQALGPWVPLVAHRPHVIHCHDFLAQRSANDEIPQHRTSWTGKQYQKMIHKGYSKGKHFISVSKKTQEELHFFLKNKSETSKMIYNGLNQNFSPQRLDESREKFGKRIDLNLSSGYILHVGGNTWYKNREGVIKIYNAWRSNGTSKLPLLLIGEAPTRELVAIGKASSHASDIHWLTNIEDEYLRLAYSGASIFLFPSIAEGFGWPIAEAMASGCPVITTNEAPMTEVAGDAGFYIDRRPVNSSKLDQWANKSAEMITFVLGLSKAERMTCIEAGIENAMRFDPENTLNEVEKVYKMILNTN